jgi:hypothetical protein
LEGFGSDAILKVGKEGKRLITEGTEIRRREKITRRRRDSQRKRVGRGIRRGRDRGRKEEERLVGGTQEHSQE